MPRPHSFHALARRRAIAPQLDDARGSRILMMIMLLQDCFPKSKDEIKFRPQPDACQ